jgi:hypothetical protein
MHGAEDDVHELGAHLAAHLARLPHAPRDEMAA